MTKRVLVTAAMVCVSMDLLAWGAQGHRLVGLIAAERLTAVAARNVAWLLDGQTLADVSSWADSITSDQQQTYYWHFLNIPPGAEGYDRDRDCPVQAGVQKGSRTDRWRDCVVDRIPYWEERLGNTTLDRADRATALKFIVHFIGDLHQPFHTLGVGRGGNDVHVSVFGQRDCGSSMSTRPAPCNLHSVWDSRLISRRNLDDEQYAAALRRVIAGKKLVSAPVGSVVQWTNQSFALAKDALVADGTDIDAAYYRRQIPIIEEQLALAGLRLAAELNRILATPPPR